MQIRGGGNGLSFDTIIYLPLHMSELVSSVLLVQSVVCGLPIWSGSNPAEVICNHFALK